MLRLFLLTCSPQGYSVKSNPDKKKEAVFTYKLSRTIFASLYHFFAVAAALSFSKDKTVFFSKICLPPPHCVSTTPRISQSCVLKDGEDPEAKLCSKWVRTSCLIAPRLSLSTELDAASLKEFWSLCSGDTLEWFCDVEMTILCWKFPCSSLSLPEQALLVGSQIWTSLRSMLTLCLHYFSTGGKLMQRRPKELA